MITKFILIGIGAVAAIAFGLGIIIGHFAIKKPTSSTTGKYDYLTRNVDQQNYKTFISSIQSANIEANLKDLTSRPHLGGLPEDLASAIVIEQRWINDGLKVTKPKYNVLLSYPDDNYPNRVTLTSGSGTIIIQTSGTEQVYDTTQPKTVNPFLAYTPNGTVSSTKLYYGNYGRLEDIEYLASIVGNASLQGSIIIMRYGKIYRGDKIMNAQYYGAAGAILYSDPIDYAPFGTSADQVYDQKWYMPPSGIQSGSTYTSNGDPLTPIYPSTDYMYRIGEEEVNSIPKIPAQPIGYGDAQVILQYLQGDNVTKDWSGSLPNMAYRYGGILRDSADAWSLGALDPSSGTAVLLEITRAIGEMYKNGFRPRRSLMFCSWGAEEYGLTGSVEYVEEYVKVLGARIISYLNVDVAVEGNYKLGVNTSPLLFDIIIEASKMVPSAYDLADQTVYDKWMRIDRNNITNEPNINYGLAAGSDYFGFVQLVGSSNIDATYTFDSTLHRNIDSYPLYHTSYEVFSMMKKFIDPDFTAHRTMGQFMGVLILILSETPVLQLNVTRYTSALRQAMNNLKINDSTILNPLRTAIDNFDEIAQDFVRRSKVMDTENPYIIRAYNDQLFQLERAFLNPLGQDSDHTDLKHIIYAPSKTNQYGVLGFPAIIDAIASSNKTEINNQIAIATFFVRGALSTLKEFDNFFS
ncbi:unnamed protein product [Adineta steineri]|uniref:Uncharacterized protein n=1 Tax=Adineta steineri TaxID=433720 RepID=A0A813UZF6_9BILA|nr:unnamed protein product [Adineta steineri]CAF0832962.1 unnamed protein product [Adineta steineri]